MLFVGIGIWLVVALIALAVVFDHQARSPWPALAIAVMWPIVLPLAATIGAPDTLIRR